MDKVWLKHYPPGVPAEIDTHQYSSLVALLDEAFLSYASRPAMACMGTTLSFSQLDRYSRDVAAWLQAQGLQRGARVALMMPNVLQYPICIMALLRAGYIVVNVNPLCVARELEHQMIDSGAQAIVVLENFATVLSEVVQRTQIQHIIVASLGDMLGSIKGPCINFIARHIKKIVPPWHLANSRPFRQVLAEGANMPLQAPTLTRDDIAFLQYTGGTTGVPKGAMLSHGNLIANVLQCEAWMRPKLHRDMSAKQQIVAIAALPLYHIFGLTVNCLFGLRLGALNILISNPRDIKALIKVLRSSPFHIFPAVNTLYNALLNHPDCKKIDFSTLKIPIAGGMAVQEAVAKKWFAVTACPIVEGYGLSETSPIATCNPGTDNVFSGTVGLPMPSTEIAIRDENNQDVAIGEMGEICIRGPQVMLGYWHRPDETAKVMSADGYFKSGDIGVMDARGYTKLVDRKKDIIIVSGFNVYPNEIEDVVASHPDVLEVAAVGQADAHSGEAVKIFVVPKNPKLDKETLKAYCQANLAGYKCPKQIEFCATLPKSTVGKILRRSLRT